MSGEKFVVNSTNEWIQSFPITTILHLMIASMKVHDQVLINQRNLKKTHDIREFLTKTTLVFLHLVRQVCLQRAISTPMKFHNILVELPPPPNTTRCVALLDHAYVTVHLVITFIYPRVHHLHKHNVIKTTKIKYY